MKCTILLPIQTVSETNMREHWSMRHKRRKRQRQTTWLLCRQAAMPVLPVKCKLVRVAPRKLDSHDNLRSSLKAVADGVCDAYGLTSDRTGEIQWDYGQEKTGAPRKYEVRLEIESL